MKAKILVSALVGVVALGALGVNASTNYTLLGDAHVVAGGNPGNAAQLSSTGTARAVVQLTSTSVATVADITNLGADHNFTVGDCGFGSPLFEIVTAVGRIYVTFGPLYTSTGCGGASWQTTGNLLTTADLRVNTVNVGGTFYDTWANAVLLVGTQPVIQLLLVVDAGGGGYIQTALIDNVVVNADVVTFDPAVATSKGQCTDGGWKALARADGTTFKNQGDCVKYTNNGK